MTLDRQTMLSRMLAADAAFDGRFITGVMSTGIYCLPSCRARKPKPENVVFYVGPPEARQAGLRPCRRCCPDAFYGGGGVQETQIEALHTLPVGELRDVPGLARVAGVSVRSLHSLLLEQLGCSPADYLNRRRVRQAQEELLSSDASAAQIAFGAGFQNLSTFGAQFRRLTGLSPSAFRALPGNTGFQLGLPAHYPAAAMLLDLGRDRLGTTGQVNGNTYRLGLNLPSGAQVVELGFTGQQVKVNCQRPLSVADASALHRILWRVLGLHAQPVKLGTFAAASPLRRVVEAAPGLRVPLSPTPFDALVWAVLGQQVTFTFACTLRQRLCQRLNTALDANLYAPPTPAQVLTLSADDLTRLGLTRRRAETLLRVAQLTHSGELDFSPDTPFSRISRQLSALRGVGVWTTQYALLRGFGAPDAVPVGDTALATALQDVFQLPHRPSAPEVTDLMKPFAPHRSLATFHLWQHFARLQRASQQHSTAQYELRLNRPFRAMKSDRPCKAAQQREWERNGFRAWNPPSGVFPDGG
ncbi:DNA-3-methyladenine glycosylase 2 family protein [Deinococcus cavernae]|nr:Ada metal-binding domain-containing protein [Deinococcus cavernae]